MGRPNMAEYSCDETRDYGACANGPVILAFVSVVLIDLGFVMLSALTVRKAKELVDGLQTEESVTRTISSKS